MSRQIFFVVFLFMFLCCKLCAQKSAAHNVLTKIEKSDVYEVSDFFEFNTQITNVLTCEGNEETESITVKNIQSVFFVAADGLMVVLAEISENDQENDKINLLAKFIETKDSNFDGKTIKESNKWKVQLAKKQLDIKKGNPQFKYSAVVVKNKKIYYIRISSETPQSNEPVESAPSSQKWHIDKIIGEVFNNSKNEKTIRWTSLSSSELYDDSKVKDKPNKKLEKFIPSGGFSFVIGDKENIILVMKGKNTGNKDVTAFFQFDENDSQNKLKLLNVEDITDNYLFFQWNNEIYMTPTNIQQGSNAVMMFDTEKNEFTKNNGSIARLRDFLKDKNNFSVVTIKEKSVLLVTQLKKKTDSNTIDVNLWITDGIRVANVGTITTENKEPFFISLLHKEDNLFMLYQDNKESVQKKNIFVHTQLKNNLSNIIQKFNMWNKNDNEMPTVCVATGVTKIPCSTDGLVGFFSSTNKDNEQWNDKYLNMNAIVATKNEAGKGVIQKVKNGFKFSGESVGAELQINNPDNGQLYNFTDPGFTLVVTVEIDSNKDVKTDNSALGVVPKDETERVELWCSEKNRWAVSVGEETKLKETDEECKQGKTYSVALVLGEKGNLEIHVDGKKLIITKLKDKIIDKSQHITYFYFGVDNKKSKSGATTESRVTITNVMLYNRPFEENEIFELKPKEVTTALPALQTAEADINNNSVESSSLSNIENSEKDTDKASDTLITDTNTEKNEIPVQSSSHLKESAVCVNFKVQVLFVFFSAFILAGY